MGSEEVGQAAGWTDTEHANGCPVIDRKSKTIPLAGQTGELRPRGSRPGRILEEAWTAEPFGAETVADCGTVHRPTGPSKRAYLPVQAAFLAYPSRSIEAAQEAVGKPAAGRGLEREEAHRERTCGREARRPRAVGRRCAQLVADSVDRSVGSVRNTAILYRLGRRIGTRVGRSSPRFGQATWTDNSAAAWPGSSLGQATRPLDRQLDHQTNVDRQNFGRLDPIRLVTETESQYRPAGTSPA